MLERHEREQARLLMEGGPVFAILFYPISYREYCQIMKLTFFWARFNCGNKGDTAIIKASRKVGNRFAANIKKGAVDEMKRMLSLVLAIAMVLGLTSCGEREKKPGSVESTAPDTSKEVVSQDKAVTLKVSFAESQGDPKYDAMEAFKEYVEREFNFSSDKVYQNISACAVVFAANGS